MLLQTNMANTIYEGSPIDDPVKDKSLLTCSTISSDDKLSSFTERFQSKASLFTVTVKTIHWNQLHDIEYLTKGGSSIIYTAFYNGEKVIVKILDPELENDEAYKNDVENELNILSTLDHQHIIKVYGAGYNKGMRFLVLEQLDCSLSDIVEKSSDGKSKFWKQRKEITFSLVDGIKHARAIADAVRYCHELAIPDCMLLHRDLKPGNIGFTSEGKLKLFDFGLARILEGASTYSDKTYAMSGKTGSLRYMAPEVVNKQPYNYKVDVYSFGVILWEILSNKRAFSNIERESEFMDTVVHGAKRPTINKNWPLKLIDLLNNCWNVDLIKRPTFSKIIQVLDHVLVDIESKKVVARTTLVRRPSLKRMNSLPAKLAFKNLAPSLERRLSAETIRK